MWMHVPLSEFVMKLHAALGAYAFFSLASQTSLFKEEGNKAVANSQDNFCPHFYGGGREGGSHNLCIWEEEKGLKLFEVEMEEFGLPDCCLGGVT